MAKWHPIQILQFNILLHPLKWKAMFSKCHNDLWMFHECCQSTLLSPTYSDAHLKCCHRKTELIAAPIFIPQPLSLLWLEQIRCRIAELQWHKNGWESHNQCRLSELCRDTSTRMIWIFFPEQLPGPAKSHRRHANPVTTKVWLKCQSLEFQVSCYPFLFSLLSSNDPLMQIAHADSDKWQTDA